MLSESQRMYPAVGGILKTLHSDLTVGDKVFPANSDFMVRNAKASHWDQCEHRTIIVHS